MSTFRGLKLPRNLYDIDASGLDQKPAQIDGIVMYPGAFTSGDFVDGFLVLESRRGGKEIAKHDNQDVSLRSVKECFAIGAEIIVAHAIGVHAFSSLDLDDVNASPKAKVKLVSKSIGLDGQNLKGTVAAGDTGRKIITLVYVSPSTGDGSPVTETFDVNELLATEIIAAINGTDGINSPSVLVNAVDGGESSLDTDALVDFADVAFTGGATPTLATSDYSDGLSAEKVFLMPLDSQFPGKPHHLLAIEDSASSLDAILKTHAEEMQNLNRPVNYFQGGVVTASIDANLTAIKARTSVITGEGAKWGVHVGQDTNIRDIFTGAVTKEGGARRVMAEAGLVAGVPYFFSPAVSDLDDGSLVSLNEIVDSLAYVTQEDDLEDLLRARVPALNRREDGSFGYEDYLTLAKDGDAFEDISTTRILSKWIRGTNQIWRLGFESGPSFRMKPNRPRLLKRLRKDIIKFTRLMLEDDESITVPDSKTLNDLLVITSDRADQILKVINVDFNLQPVLPAKYGNFRVTLT